MYHDYYNYDLKFNASFRGGIVTKKDMKQNEIKYLEIYRKNENNREYIW